MASKYVNVCGKRIKYDSRFDFRPYCFFDLREDELGITMDAVRIVLLRCRKKFKSAELSSVRILSMSRIKLYEVKVIFSISDDERLAYEREVKDGK